MVRGIVRHYRAGGVSAVMEAALKKAFRRSTLDVALWWIGRRRAFTVVQLGAYVGNSPNDPLWPFVTRYMDPASPHFKPEARAILAEPVPWQCDRLRENCAGFPNVFVEEAAVTPSGGETAMYVLDCDPTDFGFGAALSQLSSTSPDRATSMFRRYENASGTLAAEAAFLAEHQTRITVRGVTLTALLTKYDALAPAVLQIDVEGQDADILLATDFRVIRPAFIHYERALMFEREEPCRRHLQNAGYVMSDHGVDTLAWYAPWLA